MKPWYVEINGSGIEVGQSVHFVGAVDRRIRLTTWQDEDHQGSISIGDFGLVCPGVRIDSATRVSIGTNTMIASGCYLSDADWHGIYDRTYVVGKSAPITLEDNVWLGDGCVVTKGVRIGANSIAAAGSVVVSDIPKNVVVGGNPARVIKELDTTHSIKRRESMLGDADRLVEETLALDRFIHRQNSWLRWLRSLVWPRSSD